MSHSFSSEGHVMDTSCLYSTVKNISGGAKIFGFLPPHGRELANDEEFTVFGDVRQNIGGNRGSERSVQRRDDAAFEAAIEAGDLEILSTPSPILEDATLEIPKMLKLDSGTLSTVDPCWHNSIS
tara:strand:+ start:253 stop:627 length:375 start_codon:yes stop_codon:yes gene_type:complete